MYIHILGVETHTAPMVVMNVMAVMAVEGRCGGPWAMFMPNHDRWEDLLAGSERPLYHPCLSPEAGEGPAQGTWLGVGVELGLRGG